MEAVSSEDWPVEQAAGGGVRRLAPPPQSLALAVAAVVIAAGVSAAFWVLGLRAVDKHHTTGGWESGARITISAIAGIVTLLLGATRRSWWWLPTALLGTLMAAALLVQAAHWMTDLVGGGLAGVTVLATVIALGGRDWTAHSGKTRGRAPDKVSRAAAIRSRHPA